MKFKGKVIKKRVAAGSKSDHEAVCLQTEDAEYILQEIGGNAFRNSALTSLVGLNVELEGIVDRGRLMIKSSELKAALRKK